MNKKYYIAIIILAILISGGLVYLNDYNRLQGLRQGIDELELMNEKLYSASLTKPEVSDLQTYKNITYNFEFKYPNNLGFVVPSYTNLEDKILQLEIPQSDYPQTNFGDAAFSVSTTYAKSLSDCLSKNPPENSDGFKTPIQINGLTFYKTLSSGVGAGNLYESINYRTLSSGNMCLELIQTIHTGNIDNYTTGTVTEVDKIAVQDRLDQILNTFELK